MTENTFTLVDTNVIVDVTEQDEAWAEWSEDQMQRRAGWMFVNSHVYSELCYDAEGTGEVNRVLLKLGIRYAEIPHEALYLAAQSFKVYRKRGGSKTSPLPDFFIGAHASALNVPLLTRDVRRFRTYFPSVRLICP